MENKITLKEFEENFKEANLEWDGNGNKRIGGIISIKGKEVFLYSQRYKLFAEQGYTCACCGKEGTYFSLDNNNPKKNHYGLYHLNLRAEDGTMITKDHIIPKCAGGPDTMSNYQILCEDCNHKKGSKMPEGYKAMGFYTEDNQYFPTLGAVLSKYCKQYRKDSKMKNLSVAINNFYTSIMLHRAHWGHTWTWVYDCEKESING